MKRLMSMLLILMLLVLPAAAEEYRIKVSSPNGAPALQTPCNRSRRRNPFDSGLVVFRGLLRFLDYRNRARFPFP